MHGIFKLSEFQLIADKYIVSVGHDTLQFRIIQKVYEYHDHENNYSLISRHDNKDIPVTGFPVKTFTDDGQHTDVLATHIGKITHIIKMIMAGYTQHKTSSFSTIRTKS